MEFRGRSKVIYFCYDVVLVYANRFSKGYCYTLVYCCALILSVLFEN